MYRDKDGKRQAYWASMESVRTARGPRLHVVTYLGALPEAERRGLAHAAEDGRPIQEGLLERPAAWVEVDPSRVRVERLREFGGVWLGRKLLRDTESNVSKGSTVGLFHVKIHTRPDGGACVTWREVDDWRA